MRPRLAVLVVFVAATALRLAYVAEARHSVTFASPLVDAYTYDRTARRVVAEGPGALDLPFYQPPGYPLLLAAVYAVTGGSFTAPRVLQAMLGGLTVALVFALAARAGGRRAGWIAAAMLGLLGPAIWFEGELLPPAPILALDTAALLLLVREEEGRGAPWRAPAAAGLLGISAVLRPTAVLLAAAGAVWWSRGPRRGGWRTAAVALAAFAAPILPVTLANVLGGGEPVLISTNAGINFYLGNGARSEELTAIQPGHAWDRLQREPLRAGVSTRSGESAYWTRRALREAAADPGAWAAALGRKVLRLLDARETPRNTDWEAFRDDSRVLSLPLVGFGLVAPLAFVGLAARGPDRRLRGLLAAAAAAVAVENLAFFVAGRYRLEAMPALAVLAGLGADALLRAPRRALSGRAIAACVALTAVVHLDLLHERGIDEARAAINRGTALRRAGRTAEAERSFEAALAVAPGDPDAHRWLGEIALGRGDPAAAVEHFDRALVRAPDYVRVLLARAQALDRLDRRDEAEDSYRAALAADPWSVAAHLNYGVFLAVAGRRDEARRMFEEGLRLDPANEPLRRNLELLLGGS